MKYIKQLDSVRAVAVLLVIICHWVPQYFSFFRDAQPGRLGALGVDSFFVLSGFLITGILLKGKQKIEAGSLVAKKVFTNFYIRRALRIFPIFYLYLFVLFIASLAGYANREELFYGATYTINFFFYKMGYWGTYTTHLWSLAVEEQFYIFWPFVVLLINKKLLPVVMILFGLVSIITQMRINSEFGGLITYTCFDAFCLGAIFAWIRTYAPSLSKMFTMVVSVGGIISLVLFCYQYATLNFLHLPQRTLHSFIAMLFIANIVYANDVKKFNIINWLAGNRALIFVGKISYGIYLYHLILPHITGYFIAKFGSPFNQINLAWQFVINLVLLLIISVLSWNYIEKPILKYKKLFSSDEK